MELLKLNQVTKTFETGEKCTPVNSLDFTIYQNDFISIQGVSGSGKSTLLMLMGGLLKQTSGDITYLGKNIYDMSDDDLAVWRGKIVGYLYQNVQIVQALTIKENIKLARRYGNSPNADIDKILEIFDLTRLQNSLPGQLSGGQKRRAMFAVAMSRDPKIILADEPTNDLDEEMSCKIINIFKNVAKEGKSVILVTHNPKWADKANKKYTMDNGVLKQG